MFKKQSFITVFILVVLITSLRVLSECLILDYPFKNMPDQVVRFYLENIYYFLIVFLVVSAFLSKLVREELLPLMSFGVKFFPLIILPPWIDRFLAGRTDGYHYATVKNFLWNFFTLSFVTGDSTLGISLEVLVALLGIFIFVFWKTKNILKSAGGALLILLFLLVLSTPKLTFPGEANFASDVFLPFYYFFPFLAVTAWLFWKWKPKKFHALSTNLRLLRAFAFTALVLGGGLADYYAGYRVHWINLFYAAWVIFLLWEISVIVNDLHDVLIDAVSNKDRPLVTGAVTAEEYRITAALLSFLALSFAATINFTVLFLSAAGLALAIVYSVPPLRFRKNMWGYAVIGTAMMLSFLMGIYSAPYVPVSIDKTIVVFLSFLFMYGSVVPMAKDLKDIEGDSQNGVRNLFTWLGKKRGKQLYVLIFFAAQVASPAILLHTFHVPILIGLFTCAIFYKTESLKFVYVVGITQGFYLFFRLFAS